MNCALGWLRVGLLAGIAAAAVGAACDVGGDEGRDGAADDTAAADAAGPKDALDAEGDADVAGEDAIADAAAGEDAFSDDAAGDDADVAPPEPPSITLTVSGIPAEMNGSLPYTDATGALHDFTLRVNRARSSLDVIAARRAGPVDWDSLEVSCADDGGEPLALGAFSPAVVRGEEARRYVVGPDNAWPDGALIRCEADVSGPGGASSSALTFEAAAMPARLDPFPTVDPWLVVLSRDIFELVVSERPDGTLGLQSVYRPEGNGVPDFDEPFRVLGLFSEADPASAAAVKAHLLRVVRAHANRIYGLDPLGRPTPEGVPIRLWFEGDEGAPTPGDFAGGELSMIALGGDGKPADQEGGTFGRALIDWNNQEREDDSVYGLGVFPTAVVRVVVGQALGTYLLADVIPALGGTPIGDAPGDERFVGLDIDPATIEDPAVRQRAELYDLAVRMGGLALAAILTHEIGHSLGLVPFGPPPEGLFAGVEGPAFRESFAPDAHIDTEGLNIMQTGGSVNWLAAFSEEPTFNPLNWAYLRRELVVGDP